MTPDDINDMSESFKDAKSRICFLDYDGTLTPITGNPEDSYPSEESLAIIDRLCDNASIVIVSGRDRGFLENRFRDVKVDFAAEFGAVVRKNNNWKIWADVKIDWKPRVKRLFANTTCEYPFIEEKEFGIVVHFRADNHGKMKSYVDSLKKELEEIIEHCALEAIESPGSIELKPSGFNKGTAVGSWVASQNYEFILAAGDHKQDEYMFMKLPHRAFTIKVGEMETNARYNVTSHEQIIELLRVLSTAL